LKAGSGQKAVGERRILIVDDDPYMRVYLSTLLKTSGYAPASATEGGEGVRKAKEWRPLLIILDIMMPGEGGILAYRQLKTDDALRGIPVVMLTGVEGAAFRHSLKMLNLGLPSPLPEPEAYLEKPPGPEALLRTISDLLNPGPVPEGSNGRGG
jgi:CheY-like chemotaxis protein